MNRDRDYGQDRCIGCGTCNDACPSARNGGIVPETAVSAFKESIRIDCWNCLQCHRCSSVCPEGVDVAGMILLMRSEASSEEIPERFTRMQRTVSAELRAYPLNQRVISQRAELGLDTQPISEVEMTAAGSIFKGSRVP